MGGRGGNKKADDTVYRLCVYQSVKEEGSKYPEFLGTLFMDGSLLKEWKLLF